MQVITIIFSKTQIFGVFLNFFGVCFVGDYSNNGDLNTTTIDNENIEFKMQQLHQNLI